MQAAYIGSYLDFVIFKGFNEPYPFWFAEEIYHNAFFDESRFTTWMSREERSPDYHEKTLIDNDSVFLRKPDGVLFVTNMDLLKELYTVFSYDHKTNSGIVAFDEDCIEFVECTGGIFDDVYPEWFYEHFTEMVNFPHEETILFHDKSNSSDKGPFIKITNGEAYINGHCVFLRNKFGEIKGMAYEDFLKYFEPHPMMEDDR